MFILNPEFMCAVPVSGLYTLGCFFFSIIFSFGRIPLGIAYKED